MNEKKGFWASLFDFSFSELVTTKIVKILYIIIIILSVLGTFGSIIAGFNDSPETGFALLIIAPIFLFFQIVFTRIWLELIIVVFKIAENTSHLANKKRTV